MLLKERVLSALARTWTHVKASWWSNLRHSDMC